MTSRLGDRLAWRFILWGILLLMIAGVYARKGKFVIPGGEPRKVITRQNDPVIYWSVESAFGVVAVALLACGIYRARKFRNRGGDQGINK